MTTYQILKIENAELKKQLREVCLNPGSQMSITIIHGEKLKDNIERSLFYGSCKPERKFVGLLSMINK